ncbi:uncharacterized protein LOC123530322 [Mercenaria mercenaria]|uniref:uncharacterized protein LOC123530322 n=1 Tax=Mercenaria mercenaria TaxID=6596 RepID=UPI00234FAB10|nr:uncharacterized protein LOC123530322 [Mercenaria mercenaria]
MEKYSVYLFVTISIWLVKFTTSQERATRTNNNRVYGLIIGFCCLLVLTAIFVALWCSCSYSEQNKSKENMLPTRKVSVKPMELQETIPPEKDDKIEADETQEES